MITKKLVFSLILGLVSTCFISQATYYRMACLKSAVSGQDQLLIKANAYHTSYRTTDDYKCYFFFDENDISHENVRRGLKTPGLSTVPHLPSYHAKAVFFIGNTESYQPLINALSQRGKTLGDLYKALGTTVNEAPVFQNWADVANWLKPTPQ